MTRRIYTVTGNRPTGGPGMYYVTVPGVTITLETWTHWANDLDTITIKDMTGSPTPNITVLAPNTPGGAIDGASSIVMSNPAEALIFRPYTGGNKYGVTG